MTRVTLRAYLFIFIFFLLSINCGAYDSDIVHPEINEQAARQTSTLSNALVNLGFNEGLDSIILNKEIFRWLREGGTKEDETVCRSRSHFHDPLKGWDSAGLNNPAVNTFCLAKLESFSADSSVVWAQKEQTSPSPRNDWSWPKAREYYYQALTSKNDASRQELFANTFRSLGQAMHLLADLSVPAHVRNDIHVFPLTVPFVGVEIGGQTYESWAQRNSRTLNYTARHVPASIFSEAVGASLAAVPISALWDQNKYVGSNPGITVANTPVGLAEFTNANFFSEDTIFRDYQHPARENTTARLVEQSARDGTTDRVFYIQGYTSQRLAAYSYFLEVEDQIPEKEWLYILDDFVYGDYASQLVPRAVGYSAGLLNYFFRGRIEISAPDSYIYSIADGSRTVYPDLATNGQQHFTHVKAKLRNSTVAYTDSNGAPVYEGMQAGVLHAAARYRIIPDYQPYLSAYPPDTDKMKDVPYSYSVSVPVTISGLSSSEQTEFTFDFTSNPIPVGITDLILQVVFKGTLGGEDSIAVAVGMKDLSEPTHHIFWNLTDRFSLNGHLYKETEIVSNPDLASQVDLDDDGTFNEPGEPYIKPHLMALQVSYGREGSTEAPQVAGRVDNLADGRCIRLIVVTDRSTGNSVRLSWTVPGGSGGAVDFPFEAATLRFLGGAVQAWPEAKSFRGVKSHFSQGVLNCYPMSREDYCPYPENEATPADLPPVEATIVFP